MVLEARLAKLRARLAHSPVLVLVRLDYVASVIVKANRGSCVLGKTLHEN